MKNRFMQLSNNFKGIILAIIGFSAFALADANAKFLTQTYESAHIVGCVAIFSSTICLLLAPFLGGLRNTLQTKQLKMHIFRGVMNAGAGLFVVASFAKLSLAGTYTILFITPFIMTMLSIPIFKERVGKHGWIAIIGGFIGVLLVVRPGASDFNPDMILPLIAVLFIAGLMLSARTFSEKETLASLAFFPTWANLLLITPVVLYLYGLPQIADLGHFALQASLVIIGLTGTALAFRLSKASIVGPFLYLEMVWAINFDFFLFKEPPGPWTLLGAAIIIASGIYLIETERRFAQ